MSADDGIYVLQTAGPIGPEYRVARLNAVDNLFEEYKPETKTWTPNIKAVVESFANSTIFTDMSEACVAAEFINDSYNSEHGTNVITQFQDYHFSDLEDQYAKSNQKKG